MDIGNTSSIANQVAKQDVLLGAQIKLVNIAKDQGEVIMDTLLSSINTIQPAASVESHLGNKVNVSA
ncbi:hypothetical protein [Oceanospirillum maris]|uniref:hypothetical protein n=1 Tax=Oceanospirillum maris TaxID=64977 RepID=UPI0004232D8E|nr:hypothetical protein [Oceanospirillum maris]